MRLALILLGALLSFALWLTLRPYMPGWAMLGNVGVSMVVAVPVWWISRLSSPEEPQPSPQGQPDAGGGHQAPGNVPR